MTSRPEASFPSTSVVALIGRPLNAVEAKHAPPLIYYAGEANLLVGQRVASIVGSRVASDRGREFAAALATWLADHQAVVMSGLAAGIDTAAHRAALDAGGRTAAVLGTPLSQAFPAQNRDLQSQIMRDHLALSQFTVGMPVHRRNFPIRNRTMALLSAFTVIAEAAEHSGSLHQGWEVLRLGRPLFIAEHMFEPRQDWVSEFVRYGAVGLREADFDYLVDFLPEPGNIDYAGAAA
jgi:DNA processing protein